MDSSKEYWNERANNSAYYKGENFYTITPLPYYYARRNIVLKNLYLWLEKRGRENNQCSHPILKETVEEKIDCCDFGCGDGRYIII